MIRHVRALFTAAVLVLGTLSAQAQDQALPYAPVSPQQPTQVAPGKIEVLEFFWYGCPHCYAMKAFVEKWLADKPADVEFVRMPAVLNQIWMLHARAYFTAQKLGVVEKIHRPLFDALHKEHQKIFSEDALRDFFVAAGVKAEDFDRVFNSHEIEIRVKQAYVLAQNYRITGVPTFIVNGKYAVSGSLAGTYENMISTINMLVDKERGGPAPQPAPAQN